MRNVPSLDLASVRIPDDAPARPVKEFTTKELKDELIRRGVADFSKWDVLIKLSPFILLLAMGVLWKLGQTMNGAYFTCLFQ
jgi:hypothetical protein